MTLRLTILLLCLTTFSSFGRPVPKALLISSVAPTNIVVLVTNDYVCTNRTIVIDPPPTNYLWGATYLSQWSDGNTNLVPLGNFTFPAANFTVPLIRPPCTNHYGAAFCVLVGNSNFEWSAMSSVPFTCAGYEMTTKTGNVKYLSSSSLTPPIHWQTNSVPSPLIGGFGQAEFWRLASGTVLTICRESLPWDFTVVTAVTNPVLAQAVSLMPPLPK